MRLAVVGASGRMGRAVVRIAHGAGIEVVCAVGMTDVGRDAGDLAGVGPTGVCVVDGLGVLEHAHADVVIDFSSPTATQALVSIAASVGTAVVSGTTGIGDDVQAALETAASRVPVLWEANMSLGVHVLADLVARASAELAAWDVEIVETHHRAKIDAPSGTALRLADAVRDARAGRARLVYGREGKPGARTSDEVGMLAVRGGDVVGDHTVHLMGGGERLELTHRATNRDVFAHGAVRCAQWIAGRPPKRYGLRDVLGGV